MKFILMFLILPTVLYSSEVDLSESDLFIPFEQDEEFSYPHELALELKAGGIIDGKYLLAMSFFGAKGIDATKKVHYFDLNLSLEKYGDKEENSLKIQPVAVGYYDPFDSSVNGVIELGFIPMEFSWDEEKKFGAKFYLISLSSEQIIPSKSMAIVVKEAIRGLGVSFKEYGKGIFSPLEAELELELKINNLVSILLGSSFTLQNNQGDYSGKIYGGVELGIDFDSFVLQLFAEGGYRYDRNDNSYGYFTLGVKIGTTLSISSKKKEDES